MSHSNGGFKRISFSADICTFSLTSSLSNVMLLDAINEVANFALVPARRSVFVLRNSSATST